MNIIFSDYPDIMGFLNICLYQNFLNFAGIVFTVFSDNVQLNLIITVFILYKSFVNEKFQEEDGGAGCFTKS